MSRRGTSGGELANIKMKGLGRLLIGARILLTNLLGIYYKTSQ